MSDLQTLVNSLVERSVPSTSEAASGAETASRIIVAANDAAELAIASAKSEADEIIASAKAKSYEIIGVARDLANSELAAERARVAAATESWNVRRTEISERLVALQSSLSTYHSDLSAASGVVKVAIGELDAADAAKADPASESTDATATAAAPEDGADPVKADPAGAPGGSTTTVTPSPNSGDGSRRSNLFGGSSARPTTNGTSNGASKGASKGAATEATPAEPALRAGMFGR